MEQTRDWTVLDEIEHDAHITEQVAQRVRANAPAGCLMCAMEQGDDQWDDE